MVKFTLEHPSRKKQTFTLTIESYPWKAKEFELSRSELMELKDLIKSKF